MRVWFGLVGGLDAWAGRIQCYYSNRNQCYYVRCRNDTLWNQQVFTRVHDPDVPPPHQQIPVRPQTPFIAGIKNPCTVAHASEGKFYFPHDRRFFYVQCDNNAAALFVTGILVPR